jgi:hypothetical protein
VRIFASQRAMIVAKIYPEPIKYKRGGAKSVPSTELNGNLLSRARLVLRVMTRACQDGGEGKRDAECGV